MKRLLIILLSVLLCGMVQAGEIATSFDVVTRTFSISTNLTSGYCDIKAGVKRYGQTIPFKNTSFGFTASTNGVEFDSKSWPPAGVTYVSTDQDILESARITWETDAVVTFNLWLDSRGTNYQTNLVVTVPRPTKPYPSLTWDGNGWKPPVPCPDDGKRYTWNEDEQQWDLFVGE